MFLVQTFPLLERLWKCQFYPMLCRECANL